MRIFEAIATTEDIELQVRRFFENKVITLYGPHIPLSCLERLESIRDKLVELGYPASLVKDYPNRDNGEGDMDPQEKSFFWIKKSDYNIFIRFVDGDNEGLGIETNYMLQADEIISKSFLTIEMDESGEWLSTITELLREIPSWKRVEKAKHEYEKDEDLVELILAYLDRQFHERL